MNRTIGEPNARTNTKPISIRTRLAEHQRVLVANVQSRMHSISLRVIILLVNNTGYEKYELTETIWRIYVLIHKFGDSLIE